MLTLVEASKLIQNPLAEGRCGNLRSYQRSAGTPAVPRRGRQCLRLEPGTDPARIAFRAINSTYDESTGVVQQKTEALKVFGGISKVDRALVRTQGSLNDIRAVHDTMKAKAASLDFTKSFFKGDADANAFDGLEKRLTGSQVLAASTTAGGATLTLDMVDQLIDAVQGGPDCIFCNKATRRAINKLIRSAGQATEVVSDAFGRQLTSYAGVPLAVIETDSEGNEILPFTEKDAQTTPADASCCSLYAVRFGAQEYVSGLQASGGMEVLDQGLQGIFYQTLIEWICSITVFHPKAAARLMAVKA